LKNTHFSVSTVYHQHSYPVTPTIEHINTEQSQQLHLADYK